MNDGPPICINCIYYQVWFGNWSPVSMCMHKTKSFSLVTGNDENRGLLTTYNQRYNEEIVNEIKTCGKNGKWFIQKPSGFDKWSQEEKENEWEKNEKRRINQRDIIQIDEM